MTVSGTIVGFGDPPATLPPGEGRADSTLRRLKIAGKSFFVLKQRGALQAIAYDHGRLLAREIEAGVLPEIVATIARSTNLASPVQQRLAAGIYRCFTDRVLDSVSDEFRGAAEELAAGYLSASPAPQVSRQQVLDAAVAIEVGNLVEGMARRLEIPFVRVGMVAELLAIGLPDILDDEANIYLQSAQTDTDAQESIAGTLKAMADPDNRCSFACTGFSVPWSRTKDGLHLHARNLDADLYQWNQAPVLFAIDETGAGGGRHKYVAFGTAGLLYPGGISGLNDAGIAVSLHQLSTTRYTTRISSGRADIAPFVQQRILREASNLDDAADIIKESRHFAAWVIFCSDAKTGQTQRFEFNAEKLRIGPVALAPVAQTNHFVHPDLVERLFDEDDAHFTPTFGKYLETRGRFAMVEATLKATEDLQVVDAGWAIDLLSSGRDHYLTEMARQQGLDPASPAAERSYGRVPRKVYGQMASIACGHPDRHPGKDTVWMTIGERLPAPQSIFAGFRVDWQAFDLTPVAPQPLHRTEQYERSQRKNWEISLGHYLAARVTASRPKGADGKMLHRAMTDLEKRAGHERAELELNAAIEQAAADGIVEIPYHYMRARVRHALGKVAEAKADWDLLRDLWAAQNGRPRQGVTSPVTAPRFKPLMLPYEAALVQLLSTLSEDRRLGTTTWAGRHERLQEARTLLRGLRDEIFGAGGPAHFALKAWLELAKQAKDDPDRPIAPPEPNYVTVE